MRRRKKKAGDSQEVDLTPMLDVVFIMLIFFIVTASFVKEKGLDLNRPSKNQQERPDDAKKSIVINITDRNQVWIQKRPVDVRSVKANVARLLAENPGAGVVIRADGESKNGLMIQVMDQAKQAGAGSVALSEGTGTI